MSSLIPRRAPLVCKTCRIAQITSTRTRPFSTLLNPNTRSQPTRSPVRQAHKALRRHVRAASSAVVEEEEYMQGQPAERTSTRSENPAATLTSIRRDAANIVSGTAVPSNARIMALLNHAQELASMLVYGYEGSQRVVQDADVEATARPSTSTDTLSALLDDLSEDTTTQRPNKAGSKSSMSVAFRTKSAQTLCEILYYLMRDPKVNITLPALRDYTTTQCLLGKPEFLPEIFDLYAHKPLAAQQPNTITYTRRQSWRHRAAIPLSLSTLALSSAIHKRDMGLAVAITDTTVGTPAYRLHRFLTQATPKLSLLTVIPFTAYTISSWAATYQNTFEPEMAQMMALAAAAAYIGTFGSIAYVAVTTWSDHHDRVHWQVGKPLARRWLEEDERMFLDRVAQAWGFEDRKRRGEEQGEEWEALRDTVGLRGMVLDKTEFLEGMQ